MAKTRKPIIFGLIAAAALLVVYFGILTIANSLSHAIEQFTGMWYWVLILAIGFGIQVGLYSHIRISLREKSTAATAEVAAAGGISTASMIACCAHHVTDILPILGLSAAALFLVEYQFAFILLGVFSNLVGVTMMLNIMQRHNLFAETGVLAKIFRYNMLQARNLAIGLSVMVVSTAFIAAFIAPEITFDAGAIANTIPLSTGGGQLSLASITNNENKVSIEVKPIDFGFGKQLKFEVSINTHQGDLDFDLTKNSVLVDGEGNNYLPVNWEGSPPGGHHRNGTLTFPALGETAAIKLTIKDVYDIPARTFTWNLE